MSLTNRKLTPGRVAEITKELRDFAAYFDGKIEAIRAELPPGSDIGVFSGRDLPDWKGIKGKYIGFMLVIDKDYLQE